MEHKIKMILYLWYRWAIPKKAEYKWYGNKSLMQQIQYLSHQISFQPIPTQSNLDQSLLLLIRISFYLHCQREKTLLKCSDAAFLDTEEMFW